MKPDIDPQLASELLQILSDVYLRFPMVPSASTSLRSTSLDALVRLLTNPRTSIRKRAIPTLSALVTSSPQIFDTSLRDEIIQGLDRGGDACRMWITVVASLAKGQTAPKIGSLIRSGHMMRIILKQTEDVGDIEAIEGALLVSILERDHSGTNLYSLLT